MSGQDLRRTDRHAAWASRMALAAAHDDHHALGAVLAEVGGNPADLAGVSTVLAAWVAAEVSPVKVEAAAMESADRLRRDIPGNDGPNA